MEGGQQVAGQVGMCTSGTLRKRSMKPYEAFCQLVCFVCSDGMLIKPGIYGCLHPRSHHSVRARRWPELDGGPHRRSLLSIAKGKGIGLAERAEFILPCWFATE